MGRLSVSLCYPTPTSLSQPMDQGIAYTAKCLYKKKFLNEVLEVQPPDGLEDNKGQGTTWI